MTHVEKRGRTLERERAEWRGPLVGLGEPTTEQERAIEEAARIGRPVIRWPVAPPPVECLSRKDAP